MCRTSEVWVSARGRSHSLRTQGGSESRFTIIEVVSHRSVIGLVEVQRIINAGALYFAYDVGTSILGVASLCG